MASKSNSSTGPRRRGLAWLTVARGRPLGFALLVLGVAAMILLDSGMQRGRRLQAFDFYQHLCPRLRVNDGVVVVAIDDASLASLGQWPWPRSRLAELVDRIQAQHPAAIAFDAVFPEPDRLSPRQQGRLLVKAGFADTAKILDSLPDYDQQFARAIAQAPLVLAVGALPEDPGLPPATPYQAPLLRSGADPAPFVPAPRALRDDRPRLR